MNNAAKKTIAKLKEEIYNSRQWLYILADKIQCGLAYEEDEDSYTATITAIKEKEKMIAALEPLAYTREEIEYREHCRRERAMEAGMMHGVEAYNDFMGY